LNRSLRKVNNNVEVLFFLKNTGSSNPMWIWTWKTTLKIVENLAQNTFKILY